MLILYGTDGCHLCHDAEAVLQELNLAWDGVDIISSDHLLELYGSRIPVLCNGNRELNWPFNRSDVIRLLRME